MKPSEFLKKINADIIGDLSELDKRFIDKEKIEWLRDKVKFAEKEGYVRLHPKDIDYIEKLIDKILE